MSEEYQDGNGMTILQEQAYNELGNNYVAIRLIPERVMRKIELFLSNKRVRLKTENGQLVEEMVSFGEALCNSKGINALLNLIEMMINEQTVLGNFTEEQYSDYIYYSRRELVKSIIINAPDWEIKDTSIEMIVDGIMRMLKPFISRLIDNLERETLKLGVQTKETVLREANRDQITSGVGGR